jgi:VanZ family protein
MRVTDSNGTANIMKNGKRRKVMLTIVYGILLSFLYIVIFSFSSQDGDASGDLSMGLAEKCAELVSEIYGEHKMGISLGELAANFEHPLRKLAHFSEYACMGALVYLMWSLWFERGRRLYLFSVLWVFVSAGMDEFHQLFVPGRCGSFADVCLDTLGGICGLCLVLICRKLAADKRGLRRRKTNS